jgi:PDZ domain-containing secreted protein
MIEIIRNKKIIIPLIVILLLILMVTIKFPYNINVPCQIVGQQEWALIQVEPDKIVSKMFDNREDRTLNFTLLQFAREDFVQLRQFTAIENWINQDDAIANITSLDNQLALTHLSGELDKAHDNLAIVSAGEKKALQEEAEHAAELAEIQYAAYKPQYIRDKELFDNNLISSAKGQD